MLPSQTLFTGNDVTLQCVVSGDIYPIVTWKKGGERITNNQNYKMQNATIDGYFAFGQTKAMRYSLTLLLKRRNVTCSDLAEISDLYACIVGEGTEVKEDLSIKCKYSYA